MEQGVLAGRKRLHLPADINKWKNSSLLAHGDILFIN